MESIIKMPEKIHRLGRGKSTHLTNKELKDMGKKLSKSNENLWMKEVNEEDQSITLSHYERYKMTKKKFHKLKDILPVYQKEWYLSSNNESVGYVKNPHIPIENHVLVFRPTKDRK